MDIELLQEPAQQRAGVFSRLFFCWILPLLRKGKRHELDSSDIDSPIPANKASYLSKRCYSVWERADQTLRPSIFVVFLRVFGLEYAAIGIGLFLKDAVFRLSQALWLGLLVKYFDGGMNGQEGYMLAGGLAASTIFYTTIHHPLLFQTQDIGIRIHAGVAGLIFRKTMKLSQQLLIKYNAEELTKSLTEDLEKLGKCWTNLHYIWIAPIFSVLAMLILWWYVGIASLAGLGSLIVLHLPFKALLAFHARVYNEKLKKQSGVRAGLMKEIIQSIRLLKMHAWESGFSDAVTHARHSEIKLIRKLMLIRGFDFVITFAASNFAVLCTLGAHFLLGNKITSQKAFVTLLIFHQMTQVLTVYFPEAICELTRIWGAVKRIDKFLSKEERIVEQSINTETIKTYAGFKIVSYELVIDKMTAGWDSSSDPGGNWSTLEDISLVVKSGRLIAVVGPVGCGKSTLLETILQELPCRSGSITACGRVAYVSQEPWIAETSIQENILFGRPFEDEWYDCIIDACALQKDFNAMPNGDKTFVGEQGFPLSLSQRIRINLARALYADADIVLLDDPFSSVDVHEGRFLFEKCVRGILKIKAVLLVTHQIHFLQPADQIIVLSVIGTIKATGTYPELLQNGSFQFNRGKYFQAENTFVQDHDFVTLPYTYVASSPSDYTSSTAPATSNSNSNSDDSGWEDVRPLMQEVKLDKKYGTFAGSDEQDYEDLSKEFMPPRRRTFLSLRAGNGNFKILSAFILALIAQILGNGSDYWIQLWSGEDDFRIRFGDMSTWFTPWQKFRSSYFLATFAALVVAMIILLTASAIVFLKLCVRSAVALHNALHKTILEAPIEFFNSNPANIIQSLFSKDQAILDTVLPLSMLRSLKTGLQVVGAMVIVSMMSPILVVPSTVIIFVLIYLRGFFLSSFSNIRSLAEAATRPAQSHLLAALRGLTTIRAFHREDTMISQFYVAQDIRTSGWYLLQASSRWFALQRDWLIVLYVVVTTFSFILLPFPNYTDGAVVGLAIYAALTLTGILEQGLMQSVEMDHQIGSVERIVEYSKIDIESRRTSPTEKDDYPKISWTFIGGIRFHNVCLKYANGRLRDFSCVIQPKHKIAIVDKTGTGKNSFIAALFRLVEPSSGFITIDDVNIRQLGLKEVRTQISFIPQNPVLFAGNLRGNLDPMGQYSDEELIQALREVKMLEHYEGHPRSLLETIVSDGGANFTCGERLLIYLARAILKQNRILVIEEANLNVDQLTDILIQKIILESFEDCTILTTAHRLQTVIDSDLVMVIDDGRLVEFAEPLRLLQNKKSRLLEWVEEAGTSEAWLLHQLAAQMSMSPTFPN